MNELLAQSSNYKLYGVYEEAHLEGANIASHIIVGDFYGDVGCACIDRKEKWCVTCGNGLIVYYFKPPFENYTYDKITDQWKELWRKAVDKDWYPEVVYQVDHTKVRMVMDIHANAAGVYELDVYSLEVSKLLP